MAITDRQLTGSWWVKHMAVVDLRALLQDVPDDVRIAVNRVGNLVLVRGEALDPVAYLDLGDETLKWFGAPPSAP